MLTQIYMYFHAEGDLSAVFISDMTATLLTSETPNWTSDFGVAESLNRSLSVMSLCLLSAHVGTCTATLRPSHQCVGPPGKWRACQITSPALCSSELNTLVSFHQP